MLKFALLPGQQGLQCTYHLKHGPPQGFLSLVMLKYNDRDPLPVYNQETRSGLLLLFFNITRVGEPCGGICRASCTTRRAAHCSLNRSKSLFVILGIMSLPSFSPRPLGGFQARVSGCPSLRSSGLLAPWFSIKCINFQCNETILRCGTPAWGETEQKCWAVLHFFSRQTSICLHYFIQRLDLYYWSLQPWKRSL